MSSCLFEYVEQGLGVVCNKEGGFGEDDFVVEFLGEVWSVIGSWVLMLGCSFHSE